MDATPELVLVLALCAMTAVAAVVLLQDEAVEQSPGSGVASLLALSAGLCVLRFGGPSSSELRGRVASVLGGGGVGVGCALAALRFSGSSSLRGAARAGCLSLTFAAAGASLVVLLVGRGVGYDATARALLSFAFAAALTGFAAGQSDAFAVAALAVTVQILGCIPARASPALGPLLLVVAGVAVTVGALAVRADADDEPDAPWLRGFAVSAFVGTLGAATASHWWTRGVGAMIAATAAGLGGVLTLLLGRYHDDPAHRPLRSLTEVRGMDTAARRTTGAVVGLEGFLAVAAIAALVALAAARSGELGGGASAGSAVAIGASLGFWAYLRALAGSEEGRTVAHDTLLLVLVGAALGRTTPALIGAAAAALGLLVAAISERTAVAEPDAEIAAGLRRRAGTFSGLATLLMSAGALVAVLRS